MASLPVPMTVIVIGHHVDDVQIQRQLGNVIGLVDDLLAGGHGGREEKTSGLELPAQFLHKGGKVLLVSLGALVAIDLKHTRIHQ